MLSKREWFGFLLAPAWFVVPVFLMCAYMALIEEEAWLVTGLAFGMVAYFLMLVIGLPSHLLLRHRRPNGALAYVVLAAAAALLINAGVAVEYPGFFETTKTAELVRRAAVCAMTLGAMFSLSAFIFWWVAVRPKLREVTHGTEGALE